MIYKNKIKIIISSILVLLPLFIALIFWDNIPDVLLTHWNFHGVADGQAKKNTVVFLFPLIMLAAHWVCILSLHFDKRNATQSNKIYNVVLWIFPVISNFISSIIYLTTTGGDISVISITLILMSILFIIIGNYLPKCKQNTVIGVKIKWTLESEENWNATHRFTGKLWMLGGIVMLFSSLLPIKYAIIVFFTFVLIMVIIPLIYSYKFSKNDKSEKSSVPPVNKRIKIISIVVLCIILIFSSVIMFVGDVNVEFGENDFTVKSAWWQDLTVGYEVVEKLELKDGFDTGIRTFGLGSARLLAGRFQNDEFGDYTLYAYTRAKSHVIINTSKFGILVISGKTAEETEKIYNELMTRI